jgi:hypothetical protein
MAFGSVYYEISLHEANARQANDSYARHNLDTYLDIQSAG